MTLEIMNFAGDTVQLQPHVELYRVSDFLGAAMPGLAIVLDQVGPTPAENEEYAVLTVSFGEFICMKDCAYIDTNNCGFAEQLLQQGIAEATGLTKQSGFCTYPLWHFKEDFLKEIGGEGYQKYSDAFQQYMQQCPFGTGEEANDKETPEAEPSLQDEIGLGGM